MVWKYLFQLVVAGLAVAEENNSSTVDDQTLSSYVRNGDRCKPGPRLAAMQRSLGIPYIPYVTLTEAHSGSTWFRTMLNSHPCIRSHGETLRHRRELVDLWKTMSSPTKTDNKADVNAPLFAAGLKGFFTPTDFPRHDLNPSNTYVYNHVKI